MAAKKKPEKKRKDENEEILEKARKRFSAAMEAEKENRDNYVADVEFSSTDDQWPEEVKRLRGKDRPMLTINRMNGVVNQIINDYRQNQLTIKVLPASGDASEDIADTLAGLIRNIETQSDSGIAYVNGLNCSSRGGFGYFRIIPEYAGEDVFDQDLRIRPIYNPLTVYMDPAAKLPTRADAGWCFVTDMVKKEELEKQYPDADLKSFDADDDARHWCDGEELRVAEYFDKETYQARLGAFSNGMVMEIADDREIEALAAIGITLVRERMAEKTKIVWRKMTYNEVLETREYKIRHIPVVRVSGQEVDVKGKTKTRSAIFYAKDPQRMFNYWKTSATESVALASKAPWLLTPEQLDGLEDQWGRANTTPFPYLVYNHAEGQAMPQRNEPPNVPLGELTLANGASDDIKATTGLYDASLGARGNETSGRAIVARQQEGDTATYHFIDNLKKAIEQCGRILLDWIPQVYDAERVIRVLDMEGKPDTKVINQQVYDPLTGVTQVLNSLVVGKYDVVITTGPSFASQKLEMVNALQQVLPALPIVGQVAPDLIVKALPFHGADKIAERIERAMPPNIVNDPDSPEAQAAAQQQAQAQQVQAQVAAGEVQAKQAKAKADTMKAEASMVKAQADMAKATAPQQVFIQ